MQGYYYGKPKPYSEIVGDVAVQQLAGQKPVEIEKNIRLVR